MELKTAIVTGSTGAIGKAIARLILGTGKFRVIMIARNEARAVQARDEIFRITGVNNIEYRIADLSRKNEIYSLTGKIEKPVHVLVNDAAQSPRQRMETPEGIEVQWASNVLGYFWMIDAFSSHLEAGAPARVVNVASYWAGNLDLNDPEFRKRRYDNDDAYRQSKQADRMLTVAFAERFKDRGITVNSCHPGDVNSKLSNDLGFGGHETPDQGAATPVWLAISGDVEGTTGKYFADCKEQYCSFSKDKTGIEKLMNLLETY